MGSPTQSAIIFLIITNLSLSCLVRGWSYYSNKKDQCKCGIKYIKRQHRIIGGVNTEYGEYNWHVGLYKNYENGQQMKGPLCGGALISSQAVLTAAHCLDNIKGPSDLNICLKGHHMKDMSNTVFAKVKEIIKHPEYDRRTVNHDIALITFETPVKLHSQTKTIGTICLPKSLDNDFVGLSATVTGWGKTSHKENSEILKEVNVTVFGNDNCGKYERKDITKHMLCAGDVRGGKDACRMDSGGPLVVKEEDGYTLIGIVSWGSGCGRSKYPGIYARVTSHLEWIGQYVRQEDMCQRGLPWENYEYYY